MSKLTFAELHDLQNRQSTLDRCAMTINDVIDQLLSGLITITEFKQLIINAYPDDFTVDYMAGLVCPYTGIKYPTQEEIDFVDAHCGTRLPTMREINQA